VVRRSPDSNDYLRSCVEYIVFNSRTKVVIGMYGVGTRVTCGRSQNTLFITPHALVTVKPFPFFTRVIDSLTLLIPLSFSSLFHVDFMMSSVEWITEGVLKNGVTVLVYLSNDLSTI
jgi:hypothetical protein